MSPTQDNTGPVDEETVDYYEKLFKKLGISNQDAKGKDEKAECNGFLLSAKAKCLGAFYGAFCKAVDKDKSKALSKSFTSADIDGGKARRSFTGSLRRHLHTRETECKSHKFHFEWSGGKNGCRHSCEEAYSSLEIQCGANFLLGLSKKGSLDVGCGTYKYEVEVEEASSSSTTTVPTATTSTQKPTATDVVPLKRTGRGCVSSDGVGKHKDVHKSSVAILAGSICADYPDTKMKPGSKKIEVQEADNSGVSHTIVFEWLENCAVEEGEIDVTDPIRGEEKCSKLIYEAWHGCKSKNTIAISFSLLFTFWRSRNLTIFFVLGNNGGIGGFIDIGCLRYSITSAI